MKGIILAGGSGTRLYPLTKTTSKQLLPVYDKPMIYYPLTTLMLAGLKEILLISTPRDLESFKSLLGDGSHLGITIEYAIQEHPNGLAEAFIIAEDFLNGDDCMLILGDNLLHANGFKSLLKKSVENNKGATIFATQVKDPERFGVVEFDKTTEKVISIVEKPSNPKSNHACVGLYIFDNSVVEKAKKLKPSHRGELEIVDLHKEYLKEDLLNLSVLYRGTTWLDTGTHESLMKAGEFVKVIQDNKNQYIACLEEVAYEMGFIDRNGLEKAINELQKSSYKEYLEHFLKTIPDLETEFLNKEQLNGDLLLEDDHTETDGISWENYTLLDFLLETSVLKDEPNLTKERLNWLLIESGIKPI